MLEIPWDVIEATTIEDLAEARSTTERARRNAGFTVPTGQVTDVLVEHLRSAAASMGYSTYAQAMIDIQAARSGGFARQVKSFYAVSEVLLAVLRENAIDGWVYINSHFGYPQPVLIGDVTAQGNGYTITPVLNSDPGFADSVHTRIAGIPQVNGDFRPGRPETLLRRLGVQKETAELRAAYTTAEEQFLALLAAGPGVRCTITGQLRRAAGNSGGYGELFTETVTARPVITDVTGAIDVLDAGDLRMSMPAQVPGDPDVSRVPHLLCLEVFDTTGHQPWVAHINDVTVHTYRENIREQIVLPDAHRRLLDMLAFDTGHAADILDERTAGNTVIAAGPPGCGKTLTAQVYAEALHKPLYSVDAGVLLQDGINGVHNQVARVFERCRRWDAVLLLDEVDVIVGRRDHNIDRNTLTAAFLRVMETFDRLTFMTTNRLTDVDDAVLSRCTALLNYAPPTGEHARKVWQILAQLHGLTLEGALLEQLLEAYPSISPRDMRQMLRLAVQTAALDDVPLTIDVFTDVAQFRGIDAPTIPAITRSA